MKDEAIYYAKKKYFNENELPKSKILAYYSKKFDVNGDFITNIEFNKIITLITSSINEDKEDSDLKDFFEVFEPSKYWIEYVEIKNIK